MERIFRMDLKEKIRVIPDFPKPGISFKDITTLLKDGEALREAIRRMAEHFSGHGVEMIVGVESAALFSAPFGLRDGSRLYADPQAQETPR